MNDTTIVYGVHAVRALLQRHPDRIQQLLVQQGRADARAGELRRLAADHRIAVADRPLAELERLADGGVHQGIVARVVPAEPLGEADLEDIVSQAGRGLLLLVLDGVQDPHNLGACLRTADAAGVQAVVAPRDRAAGLTATVRKVAAGAAESIAFVQVTNLARSLGRLKQLGVWVVGTAGEAGKDLYEADLSGPIAIVMGAEGTGMRRLTREACDFSVRLPMAGVAESLNVSVAAGIVLYEALRQRR